MSNTRTSRIELFGGPSPERLCVAITLEELGLAYDVRVPGRWSSDITTSVDWCLPEGFDQPILIDHFEDGPSLVLSQPDAVMLHIAEKVPGRLIPIDSVSDRGLAYDRLFHFMRDLTASGGGFPSLVGVGKDVSSVHRPANALAELAISENFLRREIFMAGPQFSLADIAAYVVVQAYQHQVDWTEFPKLRRWLTDLSRRPALLRGMNAFNEVGA